MDIDLIFKIAAIGIIVSILNQVLSRSGREEQATMTTLAGLVVVLMMVARPSVIRSLMTWYSTDWLYAVANSAPRSSRISRSQERISRMAVRSSAPASRLKRTRSNRSMSACAG